KDGIVSFEYTCYGLDGRPQVGYINEDAGNTEKCCDSLVVNKEGGFIPIKHEVCGKPDFQWIDFICENIPLGKKQDCWSFLLKGNVATLSVAKNPNSDMYTADTFSHGK